MVTREEVAGHGAVGYEVPSDDVIAPFFSTLMFYVPRGLI